MSSQFKTPQFEALRGKWYKKLKQSGFEDIEHQDMLKRWDGHIFARYDPYSSSMKQEYFRLAGIFLNEHEFASKTDRDIWSLHSEGATLDEISAKVKRRNFKRSSRSAIRLIIKDLAKKMLIKYGNRTA
jgi:hypothetical protein